MTVPLLVGVLGSRIGSQEAAGIGYGNRELDLYQTGCIQPICDVGMLPLGIASADVAGGIELCDLVSALVVPHDSRRDAGALSQASSAQDQTGLPIVIGALARHLPILAIGSGECLVAEALAGRSHEQFTVSPDEGDRARDADGRGGTDLAKLLGVSGSRPLAVLTETTTVPRGMSVAASGADGSVYAVVTNGRATGPALSIRWDPGSFAPGDQAREGPFRWLRDHAASSRPSAQPDGQAQESAREEVE